MTSVEGLVSSPRAGLEVVATPEWAILCTHRLNVVFEGPQHWTENLVLFLAPHLRRPVAWKQAAVFAPPDGECAALVLEDVAALSRQAQLDLLRWLERSDQRRQVVSTTVWPLFTLVRRRLFDEALFYRLNVMLFRADAAFDVDP